MRDWVADIGAAIVWAAAVILILVKADDSTGAVLIPLVVALSVGLGFASGRYRILLVPVALIGLDLLAWVFFGGGAECNPSEGCEDDLSPAFAIIFFAFWFIVLEATIAAGVAVRRRVRPR